MKLDKIKQIYKFTVNKKEEIQTEEKTADGVLIKKELADVPYTIILKSPSRLEMVESEDEYAKEYARCVRAGMLTKPLVEKLYSNEHGHLSEPEIKDYTKSYRRLLEVQNEYTELNVKTDKTKEDDQAIEKLADEFVDLQKILRSYENVETSLFSNTADVKAQNKQIMWFTFFLSYLQKGNEAEPLIAGETLDEKLDNYDLLFDSTSAGNDFLKAAVERAGFFISLWALNKVNNQDDFKAIEDRLNANLEAEKEKE